MSTTSKHWNRIFQSTAADRLGWYENDPAQTFRLLRLVPEWEESTVFLPGVGTSVLIESLLDAGARLVLNDISSEALKYARERVGSKAAAIDWLCQDIADPLGASVPEVDVWIDRAVLHFLTDEHDIRGYFKNVSAKLKIGGHALFAEFPPHGAPKCAGLELHRYSLEELTDRLGPDFERVDHFDHTYINPAGDPRPYIYALFKRIA
jgi:SAM-dependent methyltransferase